MITLSFRPQSGEPVVLVRGTYFRICADGTLRGPDNAVTATYAAGLWQLGRRRHSVLECREAVYLRVTKSGGQREHIGPYEGLRLSGGAVFSHDICLGMHADSESLSRADIWREVALLSSIAAD
jgi:hypothetical protein